MIASWHYLYLKPRPERGLDEAATEGNDVMKLFHGWLFTFFLLMLSPQFAMADGSAPKSVESLSAWTNQSGSTLYIDAVSPDGQITGHYINRAQGFGCQNIVYPATGWVYGSSITFTVKWQSTTQSCNSITSWTGFFNAGKIDTLWQLVINGSTNTSQIRKGSDVFTYTPTVEHKSLLIEK
jgi:Avidin family